MTDQLVHTELAGSPAASTVTAADLGTGSLSLKPYFSQEWFELERDRVFRKSWLSVGRVEEIPRIDDYLVTDLEVAGTSVIVTRGADDQIRAFHNVCSHRGSFLKRTPGCGHAKKLVCPYHSWVYDSSGALLHIPSADQFHGADTSKLGLTPIHCEVWNGFIFINLAKDPTESLEEFLGELYPLYDDFFDGLTPVGGHSAVVACNWKALLDAFVETYHFSSIHAKTVPDMAGQIVGSRLYERHRVMSTAVNPDYQPTVTEMLAFKYGQGIHSAAGETRPRPPGLNAQRIPTWQSDITVLFPNFDIQIIGDWVLALWFWPVDRRTTRFVARYYMTPPENAGQALTQGYTTSRLRDVFREDLFNIEFVQRGMESGAKDHMVIQNAELAIRHGYAVLEREVRNGENEAK